MISDQAKTGIHQILLRAAKSRLPLDAGDVCDIEPLTKVGRDDMPEENIVVLTISSLLFRLLLILHVDETPATRRYFAGNAGDRPFREVFYETANLCGGAMNQELLRYFPDLGMSTPYTLNSRCVSFLEELKPGYLSQFAITINGSVRMAATICMCEYAPIDFAYDGNAAEETTGELELF
ncbi:MAG: hypothetical protein ACREX0_19530 [Noviherbaspirillum sp.]